MDSLSSSVFRARIAETLKKVCDDRAPVLITRQGGESVVLLSLEDYRSLEETAHLLRTPANAERLNAAIETLEAGKGSERKLAS